MNEASIASPDYFARVIPEPFTILGVRLLPFSLGRYRLLKRFNVAFVSEEAAEAHFDDLLSAIIMCAIPVDEFLELLNKNLLGGIIRKWSRTIMPHPWIGFIPFLGRWWRKKYAFNLVEKMQLFQQYIKDAQRIPPYRELDSRQAQSGAHWSQSMEVILRSELAWSRQEINEEPLSKAIADYFKYCESKGLISLISEEEMKLPTLLDGMTEEQLAEIDKLPNPNN